MGRPRSKRAHEQVLQAAIDLIAENGIDGASMDAIAQASGVSKATIYKHWKNKTDLCLEVMARAHRIDERPILASTDTRENLVTALAHRSEQPGSDMQAKMMPHIMAYAARNPEFGVAWRRRVMEPPRAQIMDVLRKGVAAGELPSELDLELSAALLIGPMMYRFFFLVAGLPIPPEMPRRIVDAFWKAYAVKTA